MNAVFYKILTGKQLVMPASPFREAPLSWRTLAYEYISRTPMPTIEGLAVELNIPSKEVIMMAKTDSEMEDILIMMDDRRKAFVWNRLQDSCISQQSGNAASIRHAFDNLCKTTLVDEPPAFIIEDQ